MKHIRIICLGVILAGMSSCRTSSWTTTSHTARSFVIETDIKQMPTVADLVVDTVYVRQDTTWTNSFKSITSKNTMRDVLIGTMMEKANADVIIQPRENVQVTTRSSKQTFHMEVFGYPARYRNFRTATEEDLRILNGIDPKPVNYNTIYIGSGYQKPAIQAPAAIARNIAQPPKELPKKPKKPAYLRNPFYVSIEVGPNVFFNFRMNHVYGGALLNNMYLWRMKNPNIYEGFGVGLNTAFGRYDKDNDMREWYIPIYWHNRFYMGKRKCIPFFDFRLGSFLGVAEWNHNNDWSFKELDFMGGMYYAAFLGIEFGKHVNISFGTDQFLGAVKGTGESDFLFNLNACFKLGFNF